MKNYTLFFVLLASCKAAPVKEEHKASTPQQETAVVADAMTTKIKTVVEAIEKQELSAVSFLKQIMLDSVQYTMISEREYFILQKKQLEQMAHLSANKEKTQKAINYLTAAITRANGSCSIYKADFHLNALLSNNSVYNEHHVKFLRSDFTEVKLVYPK